MSDLITIDPFRLSVALLPLAVYCLLLGLINLGRRPFLVTGQRDLAALGVALGGLMAVGPMELFMPQAAAIRFGGYVWLLMLAFYGLAVSFSILLTAPRVVIYNITHDQLRPVLAQLVPQLDAQARWAGDSLALPGLGVQLHVDPFPPMRNVALGSVGVRQTFEGWRRIELGLAAALGDVEVPRNPRGVSLITLAILLAAVCGFAMAGDPQALAQGMHDMLRL